MHLLLRSSPVLGFMAAFLALGACTPAAAPTPTPTATPRPLATPIATPTATPAPTGPKSGGHLKVMYPTIITSFPDVTQTTSSGDVYGQAPIYEGLVLQRPDGTFGPGQAQSWSVAGDGLTITLELVRGVEFHDGTSFDAAAVKNDLEWKLKRDNGFSLRTDLAPIQRVDTPDSHTLRLSLSAPDATLLANLSARPGWVASPTWRDSTPGADRRLQGVGAGHFKLVEYRPKDQMILERWAKSFSLGKKPYIGRLTLFEVGDPAVRDSAYRAGEIEVFVPTATQRTALERDSRTRWDSRFTPQIVNFFFNPEFAQPLADVRVRRAMNMVIDREAIVTSFYGGRAAAIYGMLGPAWPWCWDPKYRGLGYDPGAAKALMAEAGVPNGFRIEGVVAIGRGRGEELTPILNIVLDNFRELGIETTTQIVSDSSPGVRIDRKYFGYITPWGSGAPDIDTVPRQLLHSASANFRWKGIVDPEVVRQIDAAMDRGRAATDFSERCRHYREAERLIVEQAMFHAVAAFEEPIAYRDYVKGFLQNPTHLAFWQDVWLDR